MTTPSNIPNPNNPFDYAGFDHNEGLEYFISNFNQVIAPVDQSVVNITTNFAVSKFGLDPISTNQKLTETYSVTQNLLSQNDFKIPETITNIIANWPADENSKGYLIQITNEILQYTNTDNIDPLINTIISIETSILADANLTEADREILLCSSSIARFSSYYWFNVYNTEPPTWPTNEGSNEAPFWDWVKEQWKKIVATATMDVGTWITVTYSVPGSGGNPLVITGCVLISISTALS